MNTYSKSLMIAIAAFAMTTTGVQAYGGSKHLQRSGLTSEQQSAIMDARHLQATGDHALARDRLAAAGFDENALRALHAAKQQAHADMRRALRTGDYTAFKAAVTGTPLADVITDADDFELFREAHELRRAGEWAEASELLVKLGVEASETRFAGGLRHRLDGLSDEQREALQVARQANDRATMQAILDEAGFERPYRR